METSRCLHKVWESDSGHPANYPWDGSKSAFYAGCDYDGRNALTLYNVDEGAGSFLLQHWGRYNEDYYPHDAYDGQPDNHYTCLHTNDAAPTNGELALC